jgi:deoxycytidylate deaminase
MRQGEIVSTGWNDVPRAGGGLCGTDTVKDPTGEDDNRCWNREGGVCFNDREKKLTAELIVTDLVQKGIVSKENMESAIAHVLRNSKLKNLIEFSRSIHAEMQAIITGCQLAGERVRGGKLFSTTYPCHACARHIVASGIMEVYYIEPYRKSLAMKLHDDAISEREVDVAKVRILPYDGVAPTKYLKLFRMESDSRKGSDGIMHPINAKSSRPRFEKSLEALPALEGIVLENLRKKNLIPEKKQNGTGN